MGRKLRRSLRFGSSLLALIVAAFGQVDRAHAQGAGSVGAVNPEAKGTPPGGGSRTLTLGTSVVRNERLQTSATGSLHVAFNDRTTLNLGPNTNVVIDNYVYDPASGSGTLQASIKSGLMRFVGGQTSHEGTAAVTTPVATIGIRGNMAIIEFDPTCGWRITSLAQGVIAIRNRVSEVLIRRPGYTVCVASADQVLPEPTRASPAMIARAFDATVSRSGQTGGAKRLPTDAQAARRGIGSGTLPSASGSPLDGLSILSLQKGIGRNAAQGRQPRRVLPNKPPATPYGTN